MQTALLDPNREGVRVRDPISLAPNARAVMVAQRRLNAELSGGEALSAQDQGLTCN